MPGGGVKITCPHARMPGDAMLCRGVTRHASPRRQAGTLGGAFTNAEILVVLGFVATKSGRASPPPRLRARWRKVVSVWDSETLPFRSGKHDGRMHGMTTSQHHSRNSIAEAMFRELADQWRRETGVYSSISKKVQHPAYLRMIALGEEALPLILRELRDRPGYWFPALQAIANENPVPVGEHADPKKARAAWLQWGQERGLIE